MWIIHKISISIFFTVNKVLKKNFFGSYVSIGFFFFFFFLRDFIFKKIYFEKLQY